VLTAQAAGATLVLANDSPFPRQQLEALAAQHATVLSSVASSLAMLCDQLEAGAPKPPLRLIASAGGPLPLPLAERMRRLFPDAVLWNQYGLTEASPRVTAVPSTEPAFWRGSIGKPIAGIFARIVDGELCIKGPSVMLGYLDDPDATRRALVDGELFTGELVEQDTEGFLFHKGRKDDVVKVAGERVSLDVIASIVRELPGVTAASVIAVDDPHAGARLHVFYTGSAEPKALKAGLAKRVSQAVLPRQITALPSLPLTTTGKIDVPALRKKAKEPK
jgi:long-chain acyl-CoA synthetase